MSHYAVKTTSCQSQEDRFQSMSMWFDDCMIHHHLHLQVIPVKILDVVIGGLVYAWESFRTYWVVVVVVVAVVDADAAVIDVNMDVAVLNYHIQEEEDRDALVEVVHFDDRGDCYHKGIDDEEVDSNFPAAVESHPVPFLYYFWM